MATATAPRLVRPRDQNPSATQGDAPSGGRTARRDGVTARGWTRCGMASSPKEDGVPDGQFLKSSPGRSGRFERRRNSGDEASPNRSTASVPHWYRIGAVDGVELDCRFEELRPLNGVPRADTRAIWRNGEEGAGSRKQRAGAESRGREQRSREQGAESGKQGAGGRNGLHDWMRARGGCAVQRHIALLDRRAPARPTVRWRESVHTRHIAPLDRRAPARPDGPVRRTEAHSHVVASCAGGW